MSENNLSFELLSTSLPKAKRTRREISKECLCKGIKPNGDQCSFASLKDEIFCKRHMPKSFKINVQTNTTSLEKIDASTNTDGKMMMDIETANIVIFELINDRVEHEKQISELLEIYCLYQIESERLQTI